MKLNYFNQTDENVEDAIKLIKTIFKKIKDKNEMQVIFVSLEQIHELNKIYRQVDKPTDVLSFPNDDLDDRSLGDIFICLDKAKQQAIDYHHSIEREIGFLSVHGYLHLKGYDHHSDEEEKEMIKAQEKILKKAKLERVAK
ncbi:rRNA maturation RNase YbeY [Mycoplasmatota bacterium]|nr:rRNA maturation RNase YbeY [Mycoplasmatota bacterium]